MNNMLTGIALNELMSFGQWVYIAEDGTAWAVTQYDEPFYVEESVNLTDLELQSPDDIDPEDVGGKGSQWITGRTGQHGYNGNSFHASEFIGGGLETAIRAKHGYYAAVVFEEEVIEVDSFDGEEFEDIDAIGWGIIYRPGDAPGSIDLDQVSFLDEER